mgnify:CR=1 FL=1
MSIDNIVSIYRLATPEEKRDGVVWYARALADCMRIADDSEVPLHIVVGVCAALSPNNKWDRNVQNTRDMVQAFINGDDMDSFKVSTYHTMKRKAWSILEEMPDYDARNIYYGIRHGLTTDKTSVGKREYAEIQQAYVQAGKKVRFNGRALKAFEMQAITWVAWRRIHGIT